MAVYTMFILMKSCSQNLTIASWNTIWNDIVRSGLLFVLKICIILKISGCGHRNSFGCGDLKDVRRS